MGCCCGSGSEVLQRRRRGQGFWPERTAVCTVRAVARLLFRARVSKGVQHVPCDRPRISGLPGSLPAPRRCARFQLDLAAHRQQPPGCTERPALASLARACLPAPASDSARLHHFSPRGGVGRSRGPRTPLSPHSRARLAPCTQAHPRACSPAHALCAILSVPVVPRRTSTCSCRRCTSS